MGQRGTRLIIGVAVLIVALTSILAVRGCDDATTGTFACQLGDEWFTLETAITLPEQAQGLMHRTEIADDGGMIFIFRTDDERNFWMKNCLVDMDIMYVTREGFIVSYYTMKAQPPRRSDETEQEYENRIRMAASYPSRGKARYVIELRAGRIRELGLKKGDRLDLDFKRLKALANLADGR